MIGPVCGSRTGSPARSDACRTAATLLDLVLAIGTAQRVYAPVEVVGPLTHFTGFQLRRGRTASWHIQNGVVFFVLRGIITLQYLGQTETYSAGDLYTQPIGVVYRALNPHSEIPASLVGSGSPPATGQHK